MLKVVVPHVEMDGIARRSALAPELARGEADRIEMLRILAAVVGMAVGKDVHAAVADDFADLAADVPRQARVADRMHIARADALAGLEMRLRGPVAPRGGPQID